MRRVQLNNAHFIIGICAHLVQHRLLHRRRQYDVLGALDVHGGYALPRLPLAGLVADVARVGEEVLLQLLLLLFGQVVVEDVRVGGLEEAVLRGPGE